MLEQKRIKEEDLQDFYGFTSEQAAKVLELFHNKVAVQA